MRPNLRFANLIWDRDSSAPLRKLRLIGNLVAWILISRAMKFNKLLARAVALSVPGWANQWLDYKALKKLLSAANPTETAAPRNELAGEDLAAALAASPHEVDFFRKLHADLNKVSSHYDSLEAKFTAGYAALLRGLREYLLTDATAPAAPERGLRLMRGLVTFYTQLIALENFSVMNYCGVGKILKKHDKVTGFATKTAFMRSVVNARPFAHTARLQRLLHGTEQAYTLLASRQTAEEAGAGALDIEDAAKLAGLREVKQGLQLQRAKEDEGAVAAASALQQTTSPKMGGAGTAALPATSSGAAGDSGASAASSPYSSGNSSTADSTPVGSSASKRAREEDSTSDRPLRMQRMMMSMETQQQQQQPAANESSLHRDPHARALVGGGSAAAGVGVSSMLIDGPGGRARQPSIGLEVLHTVPTMMMTRSSSELAVAEMMAGPAEADRHQHRQWQQQQQQQQWQQKHHTQFHHQQQQPPLQQQQQQHTYEASTRGAAAVSRSPRGPSPAGSHAAAATSTHLARVSPGFR